MKSTIANAVAFTLSLIGMFRNQDASYFAKSAEIESKAGIARGTNMSKAYRVWERFGFNN